MAAESLGLGSCWVQIRNRESSSGISSDQYIKELCCLPDTCSVEAVIALGYPNQNTAAHTEDDLLYDQIHYNTYAFKEGPSRPALFNR